MSRRAAVVALLLWACAARNPVIYREDVAGPSLDGGRQGDLCRSSRDCPAGRYCSLLGCDGPGHCQTMPTSKDDYDPVCGCDGRTYGNAESAHAERVSVSHQLTQGERYSRTCGPHFVCRDGEQLEGVVCSAPAR